MNETSRWDRVRLRRRFSGHTTPAINGFVAARSSKINHRHIRQKAAKSIA
jgi:hypothetical protein